MKLPIPQLFEKKQKSEYFLTLLLQDEKASAVIIENVGGHVKIIGKHEEPFFNSLETDTDEQFLEILDKAISRAEETLPPSIETEKTIFGVKESWIEDKKINKEYLSKLKKVCEELTLTPLGFLVISEAIAHLIQQEEGNPVSAIIAEIGEKLVTTSLFRGGRLIEVHSGQVTSEPVEMVDSLLKEFTTVEVLPSRIILYKESTADEDLQAFISHQWSKSLPFLHVPQIAVLPLGFAAKAVVCGAATQLGLEVIGTIIDQTTKDLKPLTKTDSTSLSHHKKADDDATEEETIKVSDETIEKKSEKEEQDASDFGFIIDEDIALVPKEQSSTKQTHDTESLTHETPEALAKTNTSQISEDDDNDEEDGDEEESDSEGSRFIVLTSFFKRMKLPKINLGSLTESSLKNRLLLIPPALILICIVFVLLYIFQLKASISLTVQPKNVTQVQNITFSSSSENDFSKNIVRAKNESVELTTKVTANVTGKKDTGNKSKGTVTLYNNNESKAQLPSGTVIAFSNNIEFLTDKDVTVASASGDEFSGTKPGTTTVTITAKNLGPEYNLPSGSKFTVTGFNGVAAKNDNAFAGGTKKEVAVVAKKDIDALLEKLEEDQKGKALDELKKKIKSNEQLVDQSLTAKVGKTTYDHEVGDETKTVTLTGTVTYTALLYTTDDVLSFAQSLLKNKFSQDTTIPESSIKTNFEDIEVNENKDVSAKMEIQAHLLPKIDTKKVAETVTGKSYGEAQQYFKDLPQVAEGKITLIPNIPFLPQILPRMEKNITITVGEK